MGWVPMGVEVGGRGDLWHEGVGGMEGSSCWNGREEEGGGHGGGRGKTLWYSPMYVIQVWRERREEDLKPVTYLGFVPTIFVLYPHTCIYVNTYVSMYM